MASFPNSIKSFTTKANGGLIDASHPNDIQDEVTAIETNLRGGSTGQVYIGTDPPGFSSVISIHSVTSSNHTAGKSTITNLQAGPSTFTGDLTVSTLVGVGVLRPLAASTFATSSTSIVDLSTFTLASPSQLDSLLIEYSLEASTVAINNFRLRNKTDGVTVCDLNDQAGAGDFAATRSAAGMLIVRMAPSATTKVLAMNSLHQDNNVRRETGGAVTYTTAWTGTVEYAIQGACSTTLGNLRGSYQATRKPGA